jgi:hypothetical protein
LPQDIASFPSHLKTIDIQGPQSEEDLLALFCHFTYGFPPRV